MRETTAEPQRTELEAEPLPRPTFAPIAMSMGVMMLAWGILTHWSMSLFGAGVIVWSLITWMDEVRLQWRALDEQRK